MIPFETDYFDAPENTFEQHIIEKAQDFVKDPFKAPEQKQSAWEYLLRWHRSQNG